MEIILAGLSAAASILVAVIGAVAAVAQVRIKKKADEENEAAKKRAAQRAKESLLLMELVNADTKLTLGVAMALKNGHANGEIEAGLKAVHQANDAYESFHREIVSVSNL